MYQITKALANLRKMKKKSETLSIGDRKVISNTIDLLEKAEIKLEAQREQYCHWLQQDGENSDCWRKRSGKIDFCIGVDGILSTNGGRNYSSRCAADRIRYETISTVLWCIFSEGNADQRESCGECRTGCGLRCIEGERKLSTEQFGRADWQRGTNDWPRI